jgi:hypothetical protein
MTTQVIVEVPAEADYVVIVSVKEKMYSGRETFGPAQYNTKEVVVEPGETFDDYIYGDMKFIAGIREVKRNSI